MGTCRPHRRLGRRPNSSRFFRRAGLAGIDGMSGHKSPFHAGALAVNRHQVSPRPESEGPRKQSRPHGQTPDECCCTTPGRCRSCRARRIGARECVRPPVPGRSCPAARHTRRTGTGVPTPARSLRGTPHRDGRLWWWIPDRGRSRPPPPHHPRKACTTSVPPTQASPAYTYRRNPAPSIR